MKIVATFIRSVTKPIWVSVLCITLFLHIQDPMQKLHRGAFTLNYKQKHTQCNYKDQVIVLCLDGWFEE